MKFYEMTEMRPKLKDKELMEKLETFCKDNDIILFCEEGVIIVKQRSAERKIARAVLI